MTPEPLVALALELWRRAELLGWHMVERFVRLDLTPREKETVLEVLYALRLDQRQQEQAAAAARERWPREPRQP